MGSGSTVHPVIVPKYAFQRKPFSKNRTEVQNKGEGNKQSMKTFESFPTKYFVLKKRHKMNS